MSFNPAFIETRIERRLAELARHLYPYRQPVTWTASDAWPEEIRRPEAVDALGRLSQKLEAGGSTSSAGPGPRLEFAAALCETTWISAEVTTPGALDGRNVHLLLETNGEAMVFVDRTVWQGLDANRPEVLLDPRGTARKRFRIDVALFSGRDRRRKTFSGSLVSIDENVRDYRYDLRAVLGVARTLPAESTTAIRLWRALERSVNALDFHAEYGTVDVGEAASLLRSLAFDLTERGHPPAEVQVFMAGNSHIDVAWLWTFAETRQKMARTTATALRHMEEMEDYRFGQSSAQLYEWLRQDYPELFRAVQERVKEGRWEILGSAWVEPDCNISGGEALVRQLLYGQKFWREHFGSESEIMWMPDTFGYAWALPQIFRQCGIRTFVTQKLTWSETNKFPHGYFLWEGPDGSRIRCVFPQLYNARNFPEDVMDWYGRYPSRHVVPALLYPYGFGDGGGGPVREDVEMARRLEKAPGFPLCRLSTVSRAVEEIGTLADAWTEEYEAPAPVWRGELYLEFHRGTLTTHAAVKRCNRKCEIALREAELWAALAAIRSGAEYPSATLEAAWKKLLLTQFHDVVPGTSIPEVYEDAASLYEEVLQTCGEIASVSRALLVSDEPFTFTVFNSLSWPVTDWVEFEVPSDGAFQVGDADGAVVPHQVISAEEGRTRIGIEATVPAMGHTTFSVKQTGERPGAPEGEMHDRRYRIGLNERGELTSIYDRFREREWLAGPANVFQTFEDRPNNWEAWDINEWYESRPLDLFSLSSKEVVEEGPLRTVQRLVFTSPAGSVIEQDIITYRSLYRIDFRTKIDWKEQRVLLKVAFPVDIRSASAAYEMQFGTVERPTHRNTSWDAAKFEVAGHRWSDLSDGSGGVSLLNDCKYGHDISGNVMRMTLLRSPAYPDAREPHPPFTFLDEDVVFTDQGRHVCDYACYPHQGDWRNGTVREAHLFNAPLRVARGSAQPGSFFLLNTEAVVIESLKRAEDGNGFILRLYEAHGWSGSVRMLPGIPFRTVEPVTLLEKPAADVAVSRSGEAILLEMKPYQLLSLRLVP